MKKLLIAVSSQVLGGAVEEDLRDEFEVYRCADGIEALELLRITRPDVFLIDLMLPQMDGVSVLQAAFTAGICPRTVAVGTYITDYVTRALEQLGVECLVALPCSVRSLEAHIIRLAEDMHLEEWPGENVRTVLIVLGFHSGSQRFSFLSEALCRLCEDPDQCFSTQLYPAVAAACGSTVAQVERAVRLAIEEAWENRDEHVWRLFFATGKDGKVPCLSNTKFLKQLAHRLRHNRNKSLSA